MNHRQHSVPVASLDNSSGSDSHYRTLMSAVERSAIIGSGVIVADEDRLFGASPACEVALAPTSWFSSWAPRCAEQDVDTEILNWIVSHVPTRKRSQAH
jgi:hypothetical protein